MFNFEINNDQLRINPVDPFGDGQELIINLERYDGSMWVKLEYPSLYANEVNTSEEVYTALNRCYAKINVKIKELYGKDVNVPDNGFDLVRYLVQNKTELGDKEIILK